MTPSYAQRILGGLLRRVPAVGEIVTVPVARIMAHDGSGPVVANTLAKHGIEELRGRSQTVFVFDHFFPPANLRETTLHAEARTFAEKHGIPVIEGEGIAHQVLPERGLIAPGTVVVGGDSHTCTGGAFGAFATGMGATDVAAVLATGRVWLEIPATLRIRLVGSLPAGVTTHDLVLAILGRVGIAGALGMSIDFVGPALPALDVEARMKLANHAVEMGAIAGILGVDDRIGAWLSARGADLSRTDVVPADPEGADADLEIDLGAVTPSVALPARPDRLASLQTLENIAVHQVFIGSCAGGRIEDLRMAAEVLRGRRVAARVRLLIGPASREVLEEAMTDGTLSDLVRAGATILPPGCGACLGRLGTLADGEVAVATQNRNFTGRAGSAKAQLVLASPVTAAWAAVRGYVGRDPTSRDEP